MIHAFAARHPDLELTLDVGNRQYILERVLSHTADVAITGKPPADERLRAEPIADNEIVCITSADDAAVSRSRVSAAELSDRAWLLREPGSGTRALNEQFLLDRGIAPRTADAGLKRCDQAGRELGSRDLAAVPGGCGGGTRVRPGRRDQADGRAAGKALVRARLERRSAAAGRRCVRRIRPLYLSPD